MRLALFAMLLAVACGGPAPEVAREQPTPTPAPAPETKPIVEDATTGSEAASEPAPRAQPKPIEPSLTRALVLTDGALKELAPNGRTADVAAVPGMLGCDLDDERNVVWLASARDLSAYDLDDGTLHPITKGASTVDGSELIWRVQRTDASSPIPVVLAGNADGLEHCAALVVELGETPSVHGTVVAEGDREVYCLADDGEGGVVQGKLGPEAAAQKRGYDRAKLVDAKYLVALAARPALAKTAEPAAPASPRVKVDVDRCTEEAEACGRAAYVGGGRLWWIVVGNSRGDFFHEERLLYDTKRRTWWDPFTDRRTTRPGEGQEGVVLFASPDRRWGLVEGRVLSLDDASATGEWSGSFCGWSRRSARE